MALTGAVAASVALGLGISTTQANAATKIDNTHVEVQAGDTLSSISEETGTSVDQLVQLNHLSNPDQIFVGDKLIVTPGAEDNSVSTTKSTQVNTSSAQSSQSTAVQTNATTGNVKQASQAVASGKSSAGSNLGSAAEAIAQAESGGDYNARNGQYIGKYQLDASYLGGDYSPAHQDQVFQQYCQQRYGGVSQALAFRQSHGWY